MNKTKYLGSKETSKILGVHPRTLYLWEKKGTIETIRNNPKGKRFYNIEKYMKDNGMVCNTISTEEIKCSTFEELENIERLNICYARVSSNGQKDDLERQKAKLKELYPEYHLIEDIGSGINFKKRGLLKIIEYAIAGKIKELVIVHKDILLRFGYELIEHLIERYSKGKITIINKKIEMEPEEEMVKDVLQIMNVFVAKMNGRKKYTKNK